MTVHSAHRVWYRTVSGVALLALVGLAAAGCGRLAPRVSRRAAAAVGQRVTGVLARDRVRDSMTRAVRLAEPRRVFRYVTPSTARVEVREGFRAGTHFTARATPGRSPSPATVAQRYGVGSDRTTRFLATLPKGTPVRQNKVIGGAPGIGEITISRPLSPSVIDRVVVVPRSRY